jgi:alkylation response protein AidB-like acyl-CoA dehydrogenase
MDYTFSEDLLALREDLRDRVRKTFPDGFPTIFEGEPEALSASHAFCVQLGEAGFLTMAWPKEYGGQEASHWAQVVLAEEMWGHNEPRGGQYQGVNWVGPAIMHFGTPAQKEYFLPLIAKGEGFWCEGLSEPDSGSDLGSLRLRAERVDGGWEISGQKIWTSYAGFARWSYLATRTNTSAHKHEGITVFLMPMDREGIEVRPIANIAGHNDLNEVFFDKVFAGEEDVLGGVDDGWSVLMSSLAFERVGTARYMRCERLLSEVRRYWNETEPPVASEVEAWTEAAISSRVARLLTYRTVAEKEASKGTTIPPVHSSVARVANTLNDQLTTNTVLGLLGPVGLLPAGEDDVPQGGDVEREWRHGLTATVAGGTVDIQRIVIARGLLGSSRSPGHELDRISANGVPNTG